MKGTIDALSFQSLCKLMFQCFKIILLKFINDDSTVTKGFYCTHTESIILLYLYSIYHRVRIHREARKVIKLA